MLQYNECADSKKALIWSQQHEQPVVINLTFVAWLKVLAFLFWAKSISDIDHQQLMSWL